MSRPTLEDLLQRYVERLELDGTRVDAEELCSETEELLEPLKARIRCYHHVNRMLESPGWSSEGDEPERPSELPSFDGFRLLPLTANVSILPNARGDLSTKTARCGSEWPDRSIGSI